MSSTPPRKAATCASAESPLSLYLMLPEAASPGPAAAEAVEEAAPYDPAEQNERLAQRVNLRVVGAPGKRRLDGGTSNPKGVGTALEMRFKKVGPLSRGSPKKGSGLAGVNQSLNQQAAAVSTPPDAQAHKAPAVAAPAIAVTPSGQRTISFTHDQAAASSHGTLMRRLQQLSTPPPAVPPAALATAAAAAPAAAASPPVAVPVLPPALLPVPPTPPHASAAAPIPAASSRPAPRPDADAPTARPVTATAAGITIVTGDAPRRPTLPPPSPRAPADDSARPLVWAQGRAAAFASPRSRREARDASPLLLSWRVAGDAPLYVLAWLSIHAPLGLCVYPLTCAARTSLFNSDDVFIVT